MFIFKRQFCLASDKNKLHCLGFYKQLQNDHGFYYMFMQTRLSGTERITVVNKDLNNVNITAECLAADNATFIYRFCTFAIPPTLQGYFCNINGLLILISQGFNRHFDSGGSSFSENWEQIYSVLHLIIVLILQPLTFYCHVLECNNLLKTFFRVNMKSKCTLFVYMFLVLFFIF